MHLIITEIQNILVQNSLAYNVLKLNSFAVQYEMVELYRLITSQAQLKINCT